MLKLENLKGVDIIGGLGVDWRTTLKSVVKKYCV
jgi:hypothetical protein